ncbi:MAG: maleylpyruvate isomerase family mycothiol-dependent enzyme [Gordonia sp. (in: high G+C Gram-positive bacteria)]|uniref:maleylpyruvate isomerase family mycothiol-dependent enzyme n=1 Tax=Gordonia sp. (in: high G+C Gram-positive bacteria) TaxID=84139 RepID=UPI0039E533FC
MATHVPQQPVIDALGRLWSTIDEVVTPISDDQWSASSGLPGWSNADVIAHIVGTERFLSGDQPDPGRDVSALDHVRNPIGELNERWLDHYRSRSRDELMDDYRSVTAARLATLAAMSDDDWNADAMTPAGPDTYGRFMRVRVMDCWVHEIDLRDALGAGEVADPVPAGFAREEMTANLPFVVGKRAGAPDGSRVAVDFSGVSPARADLAVDGRAALVDTPAGDPDVVLHVDLADYARLVGGRPKADPSRVRIDGDQELGTRIVGALHYMI